MSRSVKYNKLIQCAKWRNVRDAVIQRHPICAYSGCTHLAECVHHVKPLECYKDDDDKMEYMAYSFDNLMPLCNFHHKMIHREMHQSKGDKEAHKNIIKEKTDDFLKKFLNIDDKDSKK